VVSSGMIDRLGEHDAFQEECGELSAVNLNNYLESGGAGAEPMVEAERGAHHELVRKPYRSVEGGEYSHRRHRFV